jgi:NAD(P)-dependent dehydrogenase (short-subunit alcohol dehydrogenase family)
MDRIALITGGSSGLGLAYAQNLGQKGYRIIILARNQERINNALKLLIGQGITAYGISCDITSEQQLSEALSQVKNITPELDFLILNAGEVTPRLLMDFRSVADLKKDIDIDLWGTIQTAWFFVPMLHEGSKILMTSSALGLFGSAGYTTYCAAKAGIINFGESLRREMLVNKIDVYVACPGDTDTPQLTGEMADQPQWMKEQSSPRSVLPANIAAGRILNRCKGNSRLLILPDGGVGLLNFVLRVLPERFTNRLVDMVFPRPRRK